jgi:hypothetical protein
MDVLADASACHILLFIHDAEVGIPDGSDLDSDHDDTRKHQNQQITQEAMTIDKNIMDEDKKMRLTAKEILEFDEIGDDQRGCDRSLKIAMTYHSNRCNEIAKQRRKWWESAAERFGLDMEKNRYILEKTHGVICIVEAGDKEL